MRNWLDKLRGTDKPYALSWEDWDKWHCDAKLKHPIRYWLAEDGWEMLTDFVNAPFRVWNSIRYWICHINSPIIHTGLERGRYHESGTLILHGCFQLLVDYIEIDVAHRFYICGGDSELPKPMRYWFNSAFRFNNKRDAQAGLKYLQWEITEPNMPDYQVNKAKETIALYTWWTQTRPARKDPWADPNLSGEHCYAIAERYEEEDDAMLVRLIKIRRGLWT